MNEYWIISCYSFITCLSSKGYPVRGFDKICNLHKQQVERKDKAIISENVNEEDNMKQEKQEKQEKQDDYVDPELADVIEELDIMEKQETDKKVENIQKTMMNTSTENRRRERAYDV